MSNWLIIEKLITKYKVFSLQIGTNKHWYNVFNLNFTVNRLNVDHSTIGVEFELFKFYFYISIYDTRHKE